MLATALCATLCRSLRPCRELVHERLNLPTLDPNDPLDRDGRPNWNQEGTALQLTNFNTFSYATHHVNVQIDATCLRRRDSRIDHRPREHHHLTHAARRAQVGKRLEYSDNVRPIHPAVYSYSTQSHCCARLMSRGPRRAPTRVAPY